MNGGRVHWAVVGLAAIVGALAALLAVEYLHRSDARSAFAQQAETAGSANYVLALMGNTVADATPIVLIDTKSQSIMIYEYMVSTHTMFLRLARKYDADRELVDNGFNNYKGSVYSGPSRDDIRNLLGGRR